MSIVSDIVNGNLDAAREAIMTDGNPAWTALNVAKKLLRETGAVPEMVLSTMMRLVDDE